MSSQQVVKLSLVIPAKDKNDPKLQELLSSIDRQDFPKEKMETLVVTEGTSESAKAIGIRRAKGELIGILASDNELTYSKFLSEMVELFPVCDAAWPYYYALIKNDDVLNRYFALIGGNDPLSFYMGKNDRYPHGIKPEEGWTQMGTIGDNGFFIKKELIAKTDLDNYYHIDNAHEAVRGKRVNAFQVDIWHKTGGNIFKFFAKRYRYGLQHAFNKNRRWHLVDFRNPEDIMRLLWFLLCSLTLIQPVLLSVRGYRKVKDLAWFLHPLICLMTVVIYSALITHLTIRRLYRLLFVPMAAQGA